MTEPLSLFQTESPLGYRPIHYLGCKVRLLDTIERTIDEVAPRGPVCDLFSGSGVVAARLARRRDVVAVDIQEYARVLASAQLRPAPPDVGTLLRRARELADRIPIASFAGHEAGVLADAARGRPEGLCEILESGSIVGGREADVPPGPGTVLTRYYGGVYFSYAQAAALDGFTQAARELPVEQRDTALAAVLGAASGIVTSVGNHFAQPVRPRTKDGRVKTAAIGRVIRQRSLDVFHLARERLAEYSRLEPPPTKGCAVRADYRAGLDGLGPMGAVYADPPYTRDHYSRFYHVLETIALGDEPAVSSVRIGDRTVLSRGLYRAERHQSPFCIKSKAPYAFAELFGRVVALDCPLVLSYSPYTDGGHPRLMKVEQLEALAREYFSSVEVRSSGRVAHSKLNANHLKLEASDDAEVLMVCR
jgi:adenine-specific DNA-methyltransferase